MGRAKRRPPSTEHQDEAQAAEPCSSSNSQQPAPKRARLSSESAEQQAPRLRQHAEVLRPGIPDPIRLSDFKLPDRPSPPLRGDDKDGHFNYELGENISSRYKILSKFGEGTFGRVLECWDRKAKDYVALKIVRNVDKYRHAAMIELEVLATLERNDPGGKWHCVALKEWFNYRGHVCMVFEKLGPSLYDFLRRNEYQPLPLALVQAVSRQLLEAVAYLHELSLVHTDLKPENILLRGQEHMQLPPVPPATLARRVPRHSAIRVIDFGSATFEDGYHSAIISTRHYRAPEVILGLGWSFACDLWSCGCILVELAAGDALFQTHDNLEHLAMMQQVLGPIPEAMAAAADKGAARFFSPGAAPRLAWPDASVSRKSLRAVRRLSDLPSLLAMRADQGVPAAAEVLEALASLIGGLLRYEPGSRTSAAAALSHPFFSLQLDMPAGEAGTPEPAVPAPAAPATLERAGLLGVSGDVAAEAVAARAARQAAGGQQVLRAAAGSAAKAGAPAAAGCVAAERKDQECSSDQ